MEITTSIETKTLVSLALAVADALECPETSASLRDPLNEIASGLIDLLSGDTIALQLRALAILAASGHSGHMTACPETESTPTANPERTGKHQARETEALILADALAKDGDVTRLDLASPDLPMVDRDHLAESDDARGLSPAISL
jgi:hypothetical protein